jgi:hypothetical protein
MILGLDVSTSITGASVIGGDGSLLLNEAWDMRNKNKFPDLYAKAKHIQEMLWRIDDLHTIIPGGVFVEQPFMFFNSGGSTAKTMATLQRFNGMVSWLCCDIFGVSPEHLTAHESRKLVGIKIPRGENAKLAVLDFIVDNEPTFDISYTKHGNPKPECFDKADSLVIARAGYEICKQKN